jgi:hypothetical protein
MERGEGRTFQTRMASARARFLKMQPYRHQGEDTGITGFHLAANSIAIEFKDGSRYLYDDRRPGRKHVEAMKKLAVAGHGLTTYINKYVRERFARKI